MNYMPCLIFLFALLTNPANSQNTNLSNGLLFDGEPYLAVNPANPRHMVVAWMGFIFQNRIQIRTRVSFDGGNNWSVPQHIPHTGNDYTSADPSLAFDGSGHVFLSLIDYLPSFASGAVYLLKSSDGGLSWSNPVSVIAHDADPGKLPIDRPWISIDRSGGIHNGNIYITTVNAKGASGPPYHPYFIRSVNNGESFEPWRFADTTGWLAGSLVQKPMPAPVVTSDGTFHCIYPSYVLSQYILPQFIIASSGNAGTGFQHRTVYASASSVAVTDTSSKKGYLLRANPANPDHLAFFNLSNENGDADVYFRESMDAGLSWSEGLRINDDPMGNGKMQDLVWAGFDTDGDLAVTWRDRRNAADTGYAASYEIYCATRHVGNTAFSVNFRITGSSIPFEDVLLGNGNDFMCVELYNDTLSAVWGDTRDGKLNIWFQRMTMNGALVSAQLLATETLRELSVVQTNTSTLRVSAAKIREISLHNLSGAMVFKSAFPGIDESDINVAGIPAAVYLLTVETDSGTSGTKVWIHH